MTRGWLIAALVGLGLLIATGVEDRAATAWETRAHTATAQWAALADTLTRVRAQLATVTAHVDTVRIITGVTATSAASLEAKGAVIIPVPPLPDTCLHVIVRLQAARDIALQAADSFRVAYLATDSALGLAQTALHGAQEALGRAQTAGDTLRGLLVTAPRPCRLLGVPCPVVGVGAVFGVSGGVQPGIAVVVPLRF